MLSNAQPLTAGKATCMDGEERQLLPTVAPPQHKGVQTVLQVLQQFVPSKL